MQFFSFYMLFSCLPTLYPLSFFFRGFGDFNFPSLKIGNHLFNFTFPLPTPFYYFIRVSIFSVFSPGKVQGASVARKLRSK